MSATEPQPAPPNPELQFSLRTLLLSFVVLGSSLAVFGAWGIVAFAVTVGLAMYLREDEALWSLTWVVPTLLFTFLFALILPAGPGSRPPSLRARCRNNMRQIAVALLHYEQANGGFPPAYVADKNGKPMHSWRVLILPYLDRSSLYKSYDFTEPWDGPHNKKLLAACPPEYRCSSDANANATDATQINYVAVVGSKAAWGAEKSRKLGPADFPGGTSNTILLVEVADSGIAWTEPRDFSFDVLENRAAESPALLVSSNHGRGKDFFYIYDYRSGANVATADGAVHYLPPGSLSTENLRKILQVGGFREEENGAGGISAGQGRRLNWPNIAALAVWLLSVGMLLVRAVRSRKAGASPGSLIAQQ